jgi:hypothetical protein
VSVFDLESYECRREAGSVVGQIRVYDSAGALVAYCQEQMMTFRKEIRIFADESEKTPLLGIKSRQMIIAGATYDVTAPDGAVVGGLRRKVLGSILKDHWVILAPADGAKDVETGGIDEDSTLKAILRRFASLMNAILPPSYVITSQGAAAGAIIRNKNLLTLSVTLSGSAVDRRLALAAATLLLIVDGNLWAR